MKFKIFRFKEVESTNNTAIRIIKNKKVNNGMVISELQKKGRGQYGKKWISYRGNLFVSFFYRLENLRLSLNQLSTINCMLVKKLLCVYYKKKIQFKKPNDLLIKNRKICGILQETISRFNKRYLIVGIGINVVKSPYINDYPTTNLFSLLNKKIPKKKIENRLKKIFEINLTKFYKTKKVK